MKMRQKILKGTLRPKHIFYIFILFIYFLQGIYIILQIWRWEVRDIVKQITCPLIKLQFYFRIKEKK